MSCRRDNRVIQRACQYTNFCVIVKPCYHQITQLHEINIMFVVDVIYTFNRVNLNT